MASNGPQNPGVRSIWTRHRSGLCRDRLQPNNSRTFFNYGTINLHDDPTDTLVVHGDYEGVGVAVAEDGVDGEIADTFIVAMDHQRVRGSSSWRLMVP